MAKRQRVILLILVFTLIGYGVFASGYSINMELPAVKYRLEDGKIQYLMHGNIFIKNKFSTITMTIMEKSHSDSSSSGWSSKNGRMISAPTKSREEALYITNSLMKSNYR